MKCLKFWQSLLLVFVFAPAMVLSQGFNNHYTFQTPYRSGTHTDAVQLSNGFIAEAGNIFDPVNFVIVTEIGLIGTAAAPPNGIMVPPTFYYTGPNGTALYAVDMVEDPTQPNDVIKVCNHFDVGANLWRIVVFKVNPATGVVTWVRRLGNNLNYHLTGSAIVADPVGNVYVLGNAVYSTGFMRPYLAMITPGPAFAWERLYNDPANPDASHEAIDLLWDQGSGDIVFTTNRSLYPPAAPVVSPDGILTVEVNGAGGLVAASRLPGLTGIRDIAAIDIDQAPNGDFVIVGRLNSAPVSQAFSQVYIGGLPGIFPATVYPSPAGASFWMTGVKPYFGGAGYVMTSFETYNAAGALIPGMLELNPGGFPANPGIIYNAPPPPGAYIQTKGLVALNNNLDFAVKGEIMLNNVPSLSMFAEFTPFFPPNPNICEDPIQVGAFPDINPFNYPFQDSVPKTWKKFSLKQSQVNGKIYDCQGMNIGAFKLAASGVEENAGEFGYKVYPNPSDGNFTLDLGVELANRYQTGEVYNALGKVVFTFNINNAIESIDLSGNVPGIYLVRLKASDGSTSDAKRIMIR